MLVKCSNVDMKLFLISLYYFLTSVGSIVMFSFLSLILLICATPPPQLFFLLGFFFFFQSILVVFSKNQIFGLCWHFFIAFFFYFVDFYSCLYHFLSSAFFGRVVNCCFLSKDSLNGSLSLIFIFYAFLRYKFKSVHFYLSMVLAVSHYDSVKNIL